MTNLEVKEYIKQNRCYNYEIAAKIGISAVQFSQWFRKELTTSQREKIFQAISMLKMEESK